MNIRENELGRLCALWIGAKAGSADQERKWQAVWAFYVANWGLKVSKK